MSSGLLSVSGAEYVGYSGTGCITQTGGTDKSVSPAISVSAGVMPPAAARTAWSRSGLLLVSGGEYVGDGGTGSFTQSGGTDLAQNGLNVSYDGTYKQNGGLLSATSESVTWGGVFVQTGGTNLATSTSPTPVYMWMAVGTTP